MSQAECAAQLRRRDALVLPSLYECGGAVVLEAMAIGIPAIATDWGGPADYLDPSCGILVSPSSREAFIEGLALALVRLARNPEERLAMGRAGRRKVVEQFDWNKKVDDVLAIYRDAIEHASPQRT
jgi:glycosyltransferase involved in cell wall biosynthesis